MAREPLKNKPLVEAILEVRWALQTPKVTAPGTDLAPGLLANLPMFGQPDPHHQLILGRFFDRVVDEYPTHEPLPAASLPSNIMIQGVHHRLRHAENWPIVQLGPGILTVNDTEKYKWEDFKPRCLKAVNTLFDVHPKPDDFSIESLVLRYIDAVHIDYASENLVEFLGEKMGVLCSLPQEIFGDSGVDQAPKIFSWETSYVCNKPAGVIHVKFATGTHKQNPALIWETVFKTDGDGLPQMPSEFENWVEAAHTVTSDWFFKLIEGGSGELKKRFTNGS